VQPGAEDAAEHELAHKQHGQHCSLAQAEAQPGQHGDAEQALCRRQQDLTGLTLVERQGCQVPRTRSRTGLVHPVAAMISPLSTAWLDSTSAKVE
jgi:hypothetical protein